MTCPAGTFTGRVCAGTHAFPADPNRIPEEFFHSYFSATGDTARGKSQRHPDDVGQLWNILNGQAAYPLDDLIPQLHVADALRIGCGLRLGLPCLFRGKACSTIMGRWKSGLTPLPAI